MRGCRVTARAVICGLLTLCSTTAVVAQEVVLEDPRTSSVVVRTAKTDAGSTLYLFSDSAATEPLPAVVFVFGYPDDALETVGPLHETPHYRSWARLVAARGMTGVLYSTADPEADLTAVMRTLSSRGVELGVDGSRIALWVASGNGPVAVDYLRDPSRVELRAAAALYAILPSSEEFMASELSTMSTNQRYALPSHEPSDALAADVPILVVRPGQDHPVLLRLLDEFVEWGRGEGAEIAVLDYPAGDHAFDARDDSERSLELIEAVLSFFVTELGVAGAPGARQD